jgi:hypothetical protein
MIAPGGRLAMASANIIFDNSQRHLTLDHVLVHLRDECGLPASAGEWSGFGQVVSQVHVQTDPPIALQLNENPSSVPEEIAELLDDEGDALDERSRTAARNCRSRIEVVGCEPTEVLELSSGGMLTRTPQVGLDGLDVRAVLRRVAAFVDGWCYDNVNGRWL